MDRHISAGVAKHSSAGRPAGILYWAGDPAGQAMLRWDFLRASMRRFQGIARLVGVLGNNKGSTRADGAQSDHPALAQLRDLGC